MSIEVIPALNPYKPNNGDLVCGFEHPESEKYLETPQYQEVIEIGKHPRQMQIYPDGQVLPLILADPNCWTALHRLRVNVNAIMTPYECPYTHFEFYSIIPIAIVSTNLEEKWGDLVRKAHLRGAPDYVLDHEWHRKMHGNRLFELYDIGRLLLGSGYAHGTIMSDGSRSELQTSVRLSNGDLLWVSFWEWYNK